MWFSGSGKVVVRRVIDDGDIEAPQGSVKEKLSYGVSLYVAAKPGRQRPNRQLNLNRYAELTLDIMSIRTG